MSFSDRFKMRMVVRENSEGGGGNGSGNGNPPAKETFSREYVHELREENKATRLKLQEALDAVKKTAEDAEIKVKKAVEESTATISTATKAANDRVVRAELKALAIKEGLIDLDDLKLVDISTITVGEDGSLDGAEKVIEEFKKVKPHKFGTSTTSTTDGKPRVPDKSDEIPKKATEMNKKEYEAKKAELIKKT